MLTIAVRWQVRRRRVFHTRPHPSDADVDLGRRSRHCGARAGVVAAAGLRIPLDVRDRSGERFQVVASPHELLAWAVFAVARLGRGVAFENRPNVAARVRTSPRAHVVAAAGASGLPALVGATIHAVVWCSRFFEASKAEDAKERLHLHAPAETQSVW